MRRAGFACLVAASVLTAACSVSTPRHGALRTAAGDGSAASADGSGAGDGSGLAGAEGSTGAGGGSSSSSSARGPLGAAGASSAAKAGTSGATGSGAKSSGGTGASGGRAASAPGVTADSVTISVVAGFTGPLSAVVTKAYEALQTWADDTNDAGGIYGRKIVLKQVDHKETADGGVAACKQALSNGSFFAVVPEGTDANVTAVSCLDAAGMPTVYYAAAADPAWKLAFADVLTSAQAGTILATYIKDQLGGTDKKIGVMYVNQSAYKAVSDTLVPTAKDLRMNVVDVESVEPNQGSFTSQLLHMQQAGVQVLVISATTEAIGILRDAKSIGFQPQVTGWGYLFDFVTQGARSLFDGVTGLRAYATVDSPLYAKYAERMDARGRNRDNRTADLEGFPTYGRGLLYGEVLKAAGPNPTRESLVAGAERLKAYDNGILSPINYGPGAAHVGASAAFPAICCNSDYTWKSQGPPRAALMTTVVVNGVFVGLVYGLLAVGLVVVYRGSRIINFAYGETGMLGAFVFSDLWVTHHLPLMAAVVVGIGLSAAIGAATEVVLIRPLRGQPPLTAMVGTLAVAALIITYASRRYGLYPHFLPPLLAGGGVHVGGTRISPTQLVILAVAVVVLASLGALYRFSSFGLRLRATALDPMAAGLVGVNTNTTSVATWALAGGLAGLSGILIAPSVSFSVFFMTSLLLRSVAAALVGGLTSLWGAFAAGIILGVAEGAIGYAFPIHGIVEVTLAAFVIALLLVRPSGLVRSAY